jgi:hypothetical protein
MARKKRHHRTVDFDPYDDFDDLDDSDLAMRDLAKDFYSTDWDEYYEDDNMTARRKIERRRDYEKVYSQLDEWEEYAN